MMYNVLMLLLFGFVLSTRILENDFDTLLLIFFGHDILIISKLRHAFLYRMDNLENYSNHHGNKSV